MKQAVLSILIGTAVTTLTQTVSAQGTGAPVISGFTPSATQTIGAGETATFFMDMDQDTFTPQAYKGVLKDFSNPVEGAKNLASAIGRFDTEPLFETTLFWIQVCNIGGCTESGQLTVIVEAAEPAGPPAALAGASELGEDWWSSAWYGAFNIAFAPWIFHAQHGWQFIFEDSTPDFEASFFSTSVPTTGCSRTPRSTRISSTLTVTRGSSTLSAPPDPVSLWICTPVSFLTSSEAFPGSSLQLAPVRIVCPLSNRLRPPSANYGEPDTSFFLARGLTIKY